MSDAAWAERQEAHDIDKSKWHPGPWLDEPDKVEWRHASGLPLLIVRASHTGALCGYVGVPEGHPLYGVTNNEPCDALRPRLAARLEEPMGTPSVMTLLRAMSGQELDTTPDNALNVHGGITYSEKCSGRICHVPRVGEGEVFWLGFDCAHHGDYSRMAYAGSEVGRIVGVEPEPDETYRDIDYVRREVESLADQIAAVKS